MKFIKYTLLLLLAAVILGSCDSNRDEVLLPEINETTNLQLIESFTEDNLKIELFNTGGKLKVGYNQIFLRLTDKSGQYVEDAELTWLPTMTMKMGSMVHQHSAPYSAIKKAEGKKTLYEGFIVFVMPGDGGDDRWDLKVKAKVASQVIEAETPLEVTPSELEFHKVYTSGMGTDGTNYVLAIAEPFEPKIGTNDFMVALFKSGEHGAFSVVDHFKIKVDPRMPGMGNHSAPGNVDLTQGSDGLYHGKIGLSMSGYWKVNLILENAGGAEVKGEVVTEDHPESSLHFKFEF